MPDKQKAIVKPIVAALDNQVNKPAINANTYFNDCHEFLHEQSNFLVWHHKFHYAFEPFRHVIKHLHWCFAVSVA